MDTKQLQQRAVGSGVAVNDKTNNTVTAAQSTVPPIGWRLGDIGTDKISIVEDDDAELEDLLNEDEGLLQMEEVDGMLVVSGDIDLHQASEFRKRAESYITTAIRPRLDLSRVPFLDSAGLAALLALSRAAKEQNKSIRLIATGSPRRVLKITGIDRVLVLED